MRETTRAHYGESTFCLDATSKSILSSPVITHFLARNWVSPEQNGEFPTGDFGLAGSVCWEVRSLFGARPKLEDPRVLMDPTRCSARSIFSGSRFRRRPCGWGCGYAARSSNPYWPERCKPDPAIALHDSRTSSSHRCRSSRRRIKETCEATRYACCPVHTDRIAMTPACSELVSISNQSLPP